MANWHYDEIEDFQALSELDRGMSPQARKRVRRARIAAFMLRRKFSKRVPKGASERARKTVLDYRSHGKKLARRLIVGAKRGQKIEYDRDEVRGALTAIQKPSILLDALYPSRQANWAPVTKRLRSRKEMEIEAKEFSFLQNPNAAMNIFLKVAQAEASCLSARLHFTDKNCMDIGAWLVLAAIRREMAPIFTGGAISRDTSKIIAALEMASSLRMRLPTSAHGAFDVWAFPMRARRPAGSSTSKSQFLDPQEIEEVATDLCGAIDVWLSQCVSQALSRIGRKNVMTLVSETLDNAERHSRPEFEDDGDWWMTGFMERIDDDSGPRFRCQIALLSIGSPISETVSECDPEVFAKMEKYVSGQSSQWQAAFNYPDQHLRTIYALQDFVSRDRDAHNEQRGGIGFGTIIRVFTDLAGHDREDVFAQLSVVSGRSCIHMSRDDCDLALSQSVGKPFNIWLNSEHDCDLPPRDGAVVELDHEFRGTLVTMSFELDPDYLERTANGPD